MQTFRARFDSKQPPAAEDWLRAVFRCAGHAVARALTCRASRDHTTQQLRTLRALEQTPLPGLRLRRLEGVAIQRGMVVRIAELRAPEAKGIGDEIGHVAGSNLPAAEVGVV